MGRQWPSGLGLEAESAGFPLTHLPSGTPLLARKFPFLPLKTLHPHPGAHAFLPMALSQQVAIIVAKWGQRQKEEAAVGTSSMSTPLGAGQ